MYTSCGFTFGELSWVGSEQFASSELPDSYREARAVTVDEEVTTYSRTLRALNAGIEKILCEFKNIRNFKMKTLKLSLIFVFLIITDLTYAQRHNIDASINYPIQFTNHWLVKDWNGGINIRLKYGFNIIDHIYLGVGLNRTTYKFDWNDYYGINIPSHADNQIIETTPILWTGYKFTKKKFLLQANILFGYSSIYNNNEYYQDNNTEGLYFSPGFNLNYLLTDKLYIGFNSSYDLIYQKVDFLTDDWSFPENIIRNKDKKIKYISIGLNIGIRL